MTNSALPYIFKAYNWQFGMEMRLKIGFKTNYRPWCCTKGGVFNLWLCAEVLVLAGYRPITQNLWCVRMEWCFL